MKKQNKKIYFRSFHSPDGMVSPQASVEARTDSERCAGGASARENMFFCFVFFLMGYFLLFIATANAQFELPTIGSVKPTIILNPDPVTPLPNSTVTITANLSGIAGDGNPNYTWFLNNIKQSGFSGLNKNTLTFKTGAIGATYQVSVDVKTLNQELFDTINLTVSDVDLTWAANSQAPVVYRAKLMPTQNSIVSVSALPSIYRPGTKSMIASANLTYNWIVDGKLDSEKSGLNKSLYILGVGNFPGNPYSIRLEIKTADGAVSLNKYITIPVVRPQLLLYTLDLKTNQPFGIALKNLTTRSTNLNFFAQAYFFTAPAKNLKWQWFINNIEVDSATEKPWLATLNLANDFLGPLSAQIKVTTQNPANELEMAQSITNLEVR